MTTFSTDLETTAKKHRKISSITENALTHGGKFHADDVFSGAFFPFFAPIFKSSGLSKCRKTMKALFLT